MSDHAGCFLYIASFVLNIGKVKAYKIPTMVLPMRYCSIFAAQILVRASTTR